MKHLKIFCLLSLFITLIGCNSSRPPADVSGSTESLGQPTRQEAVAAMGEMVMPFDLERTTHVFEKLDDGGRQSVVSDDGDTEQIALIREHLAEEAGKFSHGDFGDPAAIHGSDMAGLKTLSEHHEELSVSYAEIEGGAHILYSAENTELIAAIHAWFDQQVADHGSHATDKMHEMHEMHRKHGNH